MPNNHESEFEQESLNESSSDHNDQMKAPWNSKFGEDENFKNRQYSRTARNQPVKEATTLSKVLLFIIIISLIVPTALYLAVRSSNKEDVTPKTAQQISVERNMNTTTQATTTTQNTTLSGSETTTLSATTLSTSSQPVTTEAPVQTTQQPSNSGKTYVVNAGDNWYRISVNNGVTLDALLAANGASQDTPIQPGQVINIP